MRVIFGLIGALFLIKILGLLPFVYDVYLSLFHWLTNQSASTSGVPHAGA